MSRARRAAFALVVTLLVFAGAELGLRLLPPPPAPTITLPFGRLPREIQPDPVLGWRLVPGVRPANDERRRWAQREGVALDPAPEAPISPEGLRDRPLSVRSAGPVVFTVGDSSVFGEGVAMHETLAAQLGAVLAQDDDLDGVLDGYGEGAAVELLNLGVPGYSTWQALESARQRAALGPVAVVLYVNSDRAPTPGGPDGAWFTRPGRGLARWLGGSRSFRWLQAALDPVTRPGGATERRVRVPLSDLARALFAWEAALRDGPLAGARMIAVSPGLARDLDGLAPVLADGASRALRRRTIQQSRDHAGDPAAHHAALSLFAEDHGWDFLGGAALFAARCAATDCTGARSPFVDELHPSARGHGWLAAALAPRVAAAVVDAGAPSGAKVAP